VKSTRQQYHTVITELCHTKLLNTAAVYVTVVDGRNVPSTAVDRDRACANAGMVSKT